MRLFSHRFVVHRSYSNFWPTTALYPVLGALEGRLRAISDASVMTLSGAQPRPRVTGGYLDHPPLAALGAEEVPGTRAELAQVPARLYVLEHRCH